MPPPPASDSADVDAEYASSEDSDFAPEPEDGAKKDDDGGADSSSDSEPEAAEGGGEEATAATAAPAPKKRKRKRQPAEAEAEDAGFENSGDEAIISKGRKKRRKEKDGVAAGAADDEETGQGGLIKTRSMRAQEKVERKTVAASGPVTIDVDALWAQMVAAPVVAAVPSTEASGAPQQAALPPPADAADEETATTKSSGPAGTDDGPDTIRIRRTYAFAGKVHTEEKVVARSSAEARLYLAEQQAKKDSVGPDGEGEEHGGDGSPPRRKPKKAFRSAFEPALPPELLTMMASGASASARPVRADLNLSVAALRQRAAAARARDAKRLNTVEKSRVDWAGFVDREGIKDDLDLAGRSKQSWAGRQEFLAKVDAKREEIAKSARLAGRVL